METPEQSSAGGWPQPQGGRSWGHALEGGPVPRAGKWGLTRLTHKHDPYQERRDRRAPGRREARGGGRRFCHRRCRFFGLRCSATLESRRRSSCSWLSCSNVSRGGCSCQFGRAPASMIPQQVHTMRGGNVGTGTARDRRSAPVRGKIANRTPRAANLRLKPAMSNGRSRRTSIADDLEARKPAPAPRKR
jgi:hypothetical protein